MKDIHDASFSFVPHNCADSLRQRLLTPVPLHLLTQASGDDVDTDTQAAPNGFTPRVQTGDLTRLPPPVSMLTSGSKPERESRLSSRGEAILQALRGYGTTPGARVPSTRDKILRALTDDVYA